MYFYKKSRTACNNSDARKAKHDLHDFFSTNQENGSE